MALIRLASCVIVHDPLVALLAFALEGSNLVDTVVGANAGGLAFVDVHTAALVRGQLVAGMAVAAVTHGQVDTGVHATAVRGGAFINCTLPGGLVLAVGAVLPLITDLGERDALAAAAVKLAAGITGLYRGSSVAVQLVTAIRTVSLPVADQVSGDATAILALELIWPAAHRRTILRRLVVAIGTVLFAVTYPAPMQASDAIIALKLVVLTDTQSGIHFDAAVLLRNTENRDLRIRISQLNGILV